MITSAILIFFLWPLQAAIGKLPVGSLPVGISSSLSDVLGYMQSWSQIFPITTLLFVMKLAVGFEILVFTWRGAVWVYSSIRGVAL